MKHNQLLFLITYSITPKKLSTLPNNSFFYLKIEANKIENNPAPKPAIN